MPPRRNKTTKARKTYKRKAYNLRRRYRGMVQSKPVFTETYKAAVIKSNEGFLLKATMDGIAELPQYANLYRKYKILKALWYILPTFTGGENQNASIYNVASGPSVPPGLQSVGTARVVYAIDNTPGVLAPTTEQDMLQDNGCKIRFLDKMLVIPNRPTPDLQVYANGGVDEQEISIRGRYLNFAATGDNNTAHTGVAGYITQPTSGGTEPAVQTFDVYCKLTFQLSDPK